MHQDLFTLQEEFEKHLRPGDYTFIDLTTADNKLTRAYYLKINDFAPSRPFWENDIHHSLSNKEAVKKALTLFSELPAELKVVLRSKSVNGVIFTTSIEEYCKDNKIDFPPKN